MSPTDGFARRRFRMRQQTVSPAAVSPAKVSPATVFPATVCQMLRLFLRLSLWATRPQCPRLPGPKFPKHMGHDVNDEEAPSDHQNFSGRSHRRVRPSDGPETIGGHRRRAGRSVGKAVAGPCVRHFLSCSFIFFQFLSCSFIFFHFLLLSFMFFHYIPIHFDVMSFSLMFDVL